MRLYLCNTLKKLRRYIMANETEIRQKLYELRRIGRERYLDFMGIDVQRVRELEKSLDTQYEELAVGIRDMLKNAGKERAEQHQASMERVQGLIRKDTERMVERSQSLRDEALRPGRLAICFFLPFWTLSTVGSDDSTTLDPPTGGNASGSVTYTAANTAHPSADSGWGPGTGTINSAQVKTWFRFAFTPTTDGVYCIRPIAQMNGHWLVWTWGTCGGTAEDLGSGTARVTLRVRVDQLSVPVKEIEHLVFEQNASAGLDIESGFGYDSEVDGGASMQVHLQGGHEAVVWVECESYAQIANHGRAWVDMQTSPFFHFKVPEVYWGRLALTPIWP
jgi:hypothetical protein